MKLYYVLWSALVVQSLFPAASQNLDLEGRYDLCVKSVDEDNLENFKTQFSADLLRVVAMQPYFIAEQLNAKNIRLIDHVAGSKKPNAVSMMKHMLDAEIDLNEIHFRPARFHHVRLFENGFRTQSFRGRVSTFLPLDVAVCAGNVAMVLLLLNNGAHPYRTSVYFEHSWFNLSAFVDSVGENPVTHAERYLQIARSGGEILGSPEEYVEIVRILKDAQRDEDIRTLDSVDRCCSIL